MKLEINKNEVLRYLGYKGQDYSDSLDKLINDAIDKISLIAKPVYTYKTFDIEKSKETVILKGTDIGLSGSDILHHLDGCERCILMAVTLGVEADNLIRVSQTTDMSKAIILDACATDMTERLFDFVQDEIKKENPFITHRFSPGYGDMPLESQTDICRVLDTYRKIGLSVTENSLMIPRKSVTAVIGISKKSLTPSLTGCKICPMNNTCEFSKEGKSCDSERIS